MKIRFSALFLLFLSFPLLAAPIIGYDHVQISVENPRRIVAINSTTTEIIFALGEGARIAGREDSVQFPEEAKRIPSVGHPYYPSVEGIISLKPDVVIGTEENLPPASVTQLRSAKVPVLILEPSDKDGIEGYKRRVRQIGELLQTQQKAEQEIARFDAVLQRVKQRVKHVPNPPKVFFFYAHGPANGYIYGNHTGPHYLIEAAGGKNAAESVEGIKSFTLEAMIKMEPDVILVLERVSKSLGGPDAIAKTAGIAQTPAGKNHRIIEMEETVRSIGPRFATFVEELSGKLEK